MFTYLLAFKHTKVHQGTLKKNDVKPQGSRIYFFLFESFLLKYLQLSNSVIPKQKSSSDRVDPGSRQEIISSQHSQNLALGIPNTAGPQCLDVRLLGYWVVLHLPHGNQEHFSGFRYTYCLS